MKIKLLLPLLFTATIGFAQAPINSFYSSVAANFNLGASATALDHSASGANQTWNFNQLTSVGTAVHTLASPTVSESSTYTGTTNVIVTTSGSTSSRMFIKDAAGAVSITGLTADGLVANFNTNNATLGTFPMNYGTSNSDPVAGTYQYTTYSGTFSGTLVTSADAYGTLSLNGFGASAPYTGTVTRLKTVLTLSLNYSVFTDVGTVTQTSYSYYDATIPSNHPIFRSVTTAAVVPLLSINQSNTTLEKFNSEVLSNSNSSLGTLWIKNPVENSVEINTSAAIENANVSITDMLGKTIYQSKNNSLIGTFEIPVSLTKGIYLIAIGNENGSITKKIIKN